MKKIILYLCIIIIPINGFSCSAFKFVHNNQVFVGKNFDWHFGNGVILKNNRNQSKCTYLEYGKKNTCWTSKYGSITFNQNGKEFPYGGINETGLVVEMLWLKETIYTENSENASTISELEWIQYQLDNFSSVDQVIDNIKKLDIDPITSTIHYFITDKNGNSAIIEYIKGKVVVSKSSSSVQSTTNSSNEANTIFFDKNKSKMPQEYIPKSNHTTLRYCSMRNNLEKFPENTDFNTTSAFKILGNVAENKEHYKTYWSIVYDVTNLKLTFKTYDNKRGNVIELSKLNFDSKNTSYYDLLAKNSQENISKLLKEYNSEINMKLIEEAVKPKIMFNYNQLNKHQLNPEKSNIDAVFSKNHIDLKVKIITKKTTGYVRYFLADSELNYRKQGPYGGNVEITSNETFHTLYSLPTNRKYAYGAMHDVNGNGRLDRTIFKIPKEPFAFSGKKRWFFMPPKFKKVTFELTDEVVIKIK